MRLDRLIRAEGDGRRYFAKTRLAEDVQSLLRSEFARLAGRSSHAVLSLGSAGGANTDILVALGLLAAHAALRKDVCPTLPNGDAFGDARVAAFDGSYSPPEFFWGDIALQLGRGERFCELWTYGPKAPEESDWLSLFEGEDPVLVLLDDIPRYFAHLESLDVGSGLAVTARHALSTLLGAAGKTASVCVVGTALDDARRG